MSDPVIAVLAEFLIAGGKYAFFIAFASVCVGILIKAATGKTRFF